MILDTTTMMIIIVALTVAVLVLALAVLILYKKINTISNAYKRTFRKGRAKNLEQIIEENFQVMENATKVAEKANDQIARIESKMSRCVQNVGMVKYRAFQQSGPELSFSLALLDDNKDGVIITNIFSKQNCSVYSKAVQAGKSNSILSLEEKDALEIAMSDKPVRAPKEEKKQGISQLIAATVANNILK